MKFRELEISGCYLVELKSLIDSRGCFVKTFNTATLEGSPLAGFSMDEEFYSISSMNVLRGMHFQEPPYGHAKYVYCANGSVTDVILDIRKNSPTYGRSTEIQLSGTKPMGLFLPEGIAHGFVSRENNTLLIYKTTKGYAPEFDRGIKWDSFGGRWDIKMPIVSSRDASFPDFEEYETPF